MTGVADVPAARAFAALRTLILAALVLTGVQPERVVAQAAPSRPPDVHYDPTPHHVVVQMLSLANLRAGDTVYDLGCGDGRIVIAAVKQAGVRGVCVDIDPVRIKESRANANAAGVAARIRFLEQDLFTTDIAEASVVVLFLWPDVNMKLRPRLWRELRPGTRVISYVHDMGDWPPRQVVRVQGNHGERNLYLWTIEAAK